MVYFLTNGEMRVKHKLGEFGAFKNNGPFSYLSKIRYPSPLSGTSQYLDSKCHMNLFLSHV